jgi:hypothetical protein
MSAAAAIVAADYPVHFEVDYERKHSRLLLFFRWLLIIPNLIVSLVPLIVSAVLTPVAALVVIVTRRYPKALFVFNVGAMRWYLRVTAYLYLLTDRYPPFSLADDPDHPVHYRVDYPGSVARWRPLLAWLVALPVTLVAGVLSYVLAVVMLLVFFAILVTGRFPQGLFGLTVGILRLSARANAYAAFQVTTYPPFELSA